MMNSGFWVYPIWREIMRTPEIQPLSSVQLSLLYCVQVMCAENVVFSATNAIQASLPETKWSGSAFC